MAFYYPFYRRHWANTSGNVGLGKGIFILVLAVIIPFSGSLNPALIVVIFGLHFFADLARSNFDLRKVSFSFSGLPFFLKASYVLSFTLSIYSLYIGKFNALNIKDVAILDRYLRLPHGIFEVLFTKIGFPLLVFMIFINCFLVGRFFSGKSGNELFRVLKWLCIFAFLYLLLLPLGGYRHYRPDIVRYDTFMPITLVIMFFYGYSTLYLFKAMSKRQMLIYISAIVIFLLIFINADRPQTEKQQCEMRSLKVFASSLQDVTVLQDDCTIMEYRIINDPGDSRLNARLLYHWNVIDRERYFYQE